jgi:hypothetical protein
MAVTDTKIHPNAKIALHLVTLSYGTTAISQTAKVPDSCIPGFNFEVVKVEANALTVTATITVDCLIGSTSCLTGAITPVAATPTAGTLTTAVTTRRGLSTDTLKAAYTSNGSGAMTNGVLRVWIRPRPLNGEVAP